MRISVSTANYFHLPFEQALDIIATAGLQWVELDLFWERKQWAMAQHLRGWPARQIAHQLRQAGLRVCSVHDGGGVLESPDSVAGLINPQLAELLDCLEERPETLVFHTPHLEGQTEAGWWGAFRDRAVRALEPYRAACQAITIENMPPFEGYSVPVLTPEALADFVRAGGLGATLDTTHYAQMGTDILRAAQTLYGLVRTVHLSDFLAGKTHVFPGDGELDLAGFIRGLDGAALQSITLECAPGHPAEERQALDTPALVARLQEARLRVEGWLAQMMPGDSQRLTGQAGQ